RTALYEEEARLEEIRARLSELTLAVDRHQGRSGYCREQIVETEGRAAHARAEAEELRARVGPLADHLDTRRSEEARLGLERTAAEAEARAAETAQVEASARQASAEKEQDAARDAQVDLMGRIAALLNARESTSGSASRASADLLKLAAETDEMEREKTRAESLHASARARAAEAESLRESLAGRREQALARGTAARAEADARAREAEAHQNECSGLAGRRASLEEMVATHSAFDEGVRALLAGPEGIEVLGVVADAVETDSTYERAVEAFLGDRLQAVLAPDTSHALRGIRHLQDSGAGRGAFLPLASARTRADCASLRDVARQEAPTRGLLSDLYRVTGPHAAPIRAALPDALVVETLEDALAIVSRHGPVPCVTLAGETLRGSMVEGGRGVKGLLAPRREIREVSARQDEVEGLLREARERGQEAAARAEAAVADARALEERIHAA